MAPKKERKDEWLPQEKIAPPLPIIFPISGKSYFQRERRQCSVYIRVPQGFQGLELDHHVGPKTGAALNLGRQRCFPKRVPPVFDSAIIH